MSSFIDFFGARALQDNAEKAGWYSAIEGCETEAWKYGSLAAGQIFLEAGGAEATLKLAKWLRLASKNGLLIKGFQGSRGANPFHGLDRAIERGVRPNNLLNTVRNPTRVVPQSGGRTLYLTNDAAVVLDSSGQVVTTWSGAEHTAKTLELLSGVMK